MRRVFLIAVALAFTGFGTLTAVSAKGDVVFIQNFDPSASNHSGQPVAAGNDYWVGSGPGTVVLEPAPKRRGFCTASRQVRLEEYLWPRATFSV